MEKYLQLRQHGLFDAKVPRYTSYPPANHFQPDVGRQYQGDWLNVVPDGTAISLYLHIPFCKRLCWFCACRTQGTRSLRPVETYIDTLISEITMVRAQLPANIVISRLHLGGGTPTILPAGTMTRLIDAIYAAFDRASDYEFSVEIDPTEASDDLLHTLADFGMNRASIGVQDFDRAVQDAIGRQQSYEQTNRVIRILRAAGVGSLNMDLLYGLPHQTSQSLSDTLQKVMALNPDRLALYGYAHVPWMSKRQVMIDAEKLPTPEKRHALTEMAREQLVADGFREIGIDHFARPADGLARAQSNGKLRRNFQGYTDDQSDYLIGLGASAISRFPQGYVQNVSATSIYQEHVRNERLPGLRGYRMTARDTVIAQMIADLLCTFALDMPDLIRRFPDHADTITDTVARLRSKYAVVTTHEGGVLTINPEARSLVRIIAAALDQFSSDKQAHSSAI